MKYIRIYKYCTAAIFLITFFSFCGPFRQTNAKITPIPNNDRAWLFKRSKNLDNGVSISWLEQTWNKDILNDTTVTKADFVLLKKLGFKCIRLPVAFAYFENNKVSMEEVFKRIDWVLLMCKKQGFSLIIDYHYGNLKDDNYNAETPKIIDSWIKLADRYKSVSPDKLFFEIYNEPTCSDQVWKDAAYNVITALHQFDKNRTLLLGASNYNSIYELSRFVRFGDDNIIYVVHFYEPFFFTHQGAAWVGNQVATIGVPFPYNEEKFPAIDPKAKNTWGETNYKQYPKDGNEQSLNDKLSGYVKPWIEKYNVPVVCTEYGSYNKYADQDSRCRYVKAIRRTLKTLGMPGVMWDYNGSFSIFNGKPSVETLPDCMKDAIDYAN